MRKQQSGFTLIELMIVVAIIGILAAIAIPAYQDYTLRAKVTEGINLAAAAKSAVSEYYVSQGSFPTDNAAAGLNTTIKSDYVSSVTVSAGKITVTLAGPTEISGKTFTLTPTYADGAIKWTCATGTVEKKYLPANCRG